ncbi:MAG: type II toxin-antitoxin system VapC family toxin [Actinomycetota bacterium]|nr:type II toxin-antitoxin system VapC family toxin [Actinomycetota bacterium]
MIYLDTSAFLKSVLDEPQSPALRRYLDEVDPDALVSSKLLAVESRRGILRNRRARMPAVDAALAVVTLLDISDTVIESASRLPDPMLRSLDAIHLATAMLIREDVDVLLSYDDRLTAAAASHGLKTASPR